MADWMNLISTLFSLTSITPPTHWSPQSLINPFLKQSPYNDITNTSNNIKSSITNVPEPQFFFLYKVNQSGDWFIYNVKPPHISSGDSFGKEWNEVFSSSLPNQPLWHEIKKTRVRSQIGNGYYISHVLLPRIDILEWQMECAIVGSDGWNMKRRGNGRLGLLCDEDDDHHEDDHDISPQKYILPSPDPFIHYDVDIYYIIGFAKLHLGCFQNISPLSCSLSPPVHYSI